MKARTSMQWIAGGALGALIVVAVGSGTAVADDSTVEDGGIEVSVDVEDITPPGELSMTIAANDGVALHEEGSTDEVRQFLGTTPTVTVSDTRDTDDIPAGAYWAVVGQASDFVDADDPSKTIGPDYLGWAPQLLTGSTTGSVSAGAPISSVEEDGSGAPAVGLEGQELLVSTFYSADETGSWDVNADLALRTPVDVAAGSYTSTLTLTLIEQS